MNGITFTREELHELVWSEPLTKIALKFNLTQAVEKAYKTSRAFIDYIHTLFIPSYEQYLSTLLTQNPISYNTVRNIYIVTSTEMVWEFAVAGKEKRKKK